MSKQRWSWQRNATDAPRIQPRGCSADLDHIVEVNEKEHVMGIAIANEIVGEQEALKYLVSCSKSAADAARKDGGTDLWCFQNIDDGITIFDDDAGEILHTFTLSDLSVDLSRPAREHLYYIGEEIWDMVYKLGISCTG